MYKWLILTELLETGQFNLVDLPSQLEPAKYERMVFGAILVLMVILRPQGIIPSRRRTRELVEK